MTLSSRGTSTEMKSTILQTRSLLEPLAVATVIAFLVISGVLTFEGFRRLRQHRLMVRHTNEVLLALEQTELALIDAETGQRGFVIAGREEYLEPLTAGMSRIEGAVGQLAKLINTDPLHTAQIRELRKLVAEKVAKLRITIRARIDGEIEPAQAAVNKEVGKNVMARIRQVIGQMRDVESRLIVEREAVAEATYRYGLLTTVSTTLVALTLFGAVLYLISNNRRRAVKASRIIQAEM